MRKLFLFFVFIPLFISAQSDIKHLTFMGIPLTGSLDDFSEKLITKKPSWKCIEFIADSICRFKGDFFDIKDCTIVIKANKNYHNQVTNATVYATSNLEDLVRGMMDKYGNADTHKKELGGVESTWVLDSGKIHMELFAIPESPIIAITYTDFVEVTNELKRSIKKYDDL